MVCKCFQMCPDRSVCLLAELVMCMICEYLVQSVSYYCNLAAHRSPHDPTLSCVFERRSWCIRHKRAQSHASVCVAATQILSGSSVGAVASTSSCAVLQASSARPHEIDDGKDGQQRQRRCQCAGPATVQVDERLTKSIRRHLGRKAAMLLCTMIAGR